MVYFNHGLVRDAGREDQPGYAEMKKDTARPSIVEDSLKAIPNVDSHAALRQGLADTMAALLNGDISADDGRAIAKATKRRRNSINRDALKDLVRK